VRSFYNKPVTRKRAPLVDDGQGGFERDWSAAVSEPLGGWGVSAGGTEEDEERRDGSRVEYTVRGAFDADVLPSDRVVLFGDEFEIDGGVLRQPSPNGLADHTILRLKRWEG
jgi:hypothetical protein